MKEARAVSTTAVLPPTSTPAGWFGCFGQPLDGRANPISLAIPCGNDAIESCCYIGDVCLSNSFCRNTKNAGFVQYYGAWCTDPTYSAGQCNPNCLYEPSVPCSDSSEIEFWQCTNSSTCDISNTTMGMTTFLAPAPTDLVNMTTINTIEPTSIQSQYIPTLWNDHSISTSVTSSVSAAPAVTSAGAILSSTGSSSSNPKTIAVAVAVPVVVVLALAGIITFCWRRRVARRREEATRGTYQMAETKSPMLDSTAVNEIDGQAHAPEMADGDTRVELPGINNPTELSVTSR